MGPFLSKGSVVVRGSGTYRRAKPVQPEALGRSLDGVRPRPSTLSGPASSHSGATRRPPSRRKAE